MLRLLFNLFFTSFIVISCQNQQIKCDMLIKNGIIYDGSGESPFEGNVAIQDDKIVYIGLGGEFIADTIIDASGYSIAPGFINMLSWAYGGLVNDGRSLSDLKQGVTLEVFGEGSSPGPLSEKMKNEIYERNTNMDSIPYTSFGEALQYLENKGVSTNIASFLGATTVRIHEVGYENRDATPEELDKMKSLVGVSMQEGAMGIGSSLIYAPADYASTEELIELCKVASEFGGMYISHMRNEDNKLMKALEELIRISVEASIPAEIYHLKASRKPNWHLLDSLIDRVNQVREEGHRITADIYTYNASSTGLTGVIPTWVQEGGHIAWINRMKDSNIREKLLSDIRKELLEQPPEGILMVGFRKDHMEEKYLGKTVAEAAVMRNQSPEEAIVEMVIEDDNRIQCIYFSMSEENIRKKIQIPWVSFCSDAGSYSDISSDFKTHPRAFGSFIRVLGKYARDEQLISIQEGIRKLSSLPATNLGIKDRGFLKEGYYADIVIFDLENVNDYATFDQPLQFAQGVEHVLVNGTPVLLNGNHTNKFPGRFVKGPGSLKK